jgi:sporulation protein YlmC with PRC-barrel domain
MSSDKSLTSDDEGKSVVNSNGDKIGRVIEVKNGAAYVDPDPGLTDTIMSKLGWSDKDEEETYRLDPSKISTVTGDEVRVTM